jgi:hypothetical protein
MRLQPITGFHVSFVQLMMVPTSHLLEKVKGANPFIVCWLQVAHLERRYAHAMESPQPIKRYEGYDKLLTGATRRYNAALRTLAQVRRLQGQSLGRTRSAATGEDNALGARSGNLML